MTDAPAAILATFSDLRLVKSRKTAQLVFEVPMEKLKEALDALGMPDPQGDVWCGIARVHANRKNLATADGMPIEGKFMGDAPTREDGEPLDTALVHSPTKPKKRWHEMPASQRAALLTGHTDFWVYLGTCGVAEPRTAMAADTSLKFLCNIQSKRELDEREKAAAAFERLSGNFLAWKRAKQLGAA